MRTDRRVTRTRIRLFRLAEPLIVVIDPALFPTTLPDLFTTRPSPRLLLLVLAAAARQSDQRVHAPPEEPAQHRQHQEITQEHPGPPILGRPGPDPTPSTEPH